MVRTVFSFLAYLFFAQATVADEVTVGTGEPDMLTTGLLFQSVCGETLPRFRRAERILENRGFVRNPDTGTYYHQSINLSFRIGTANGSPVCSMVAIGRSIDDTMPLSIAVAAFSDVWESDETVIDVYESGQLLGVTHPRGHRLEIRTQRHGSERTVNAVIYSAN